MPRGKHEEGDFYHIRLRDPDKLRSMRTTKFGPLKKVRGIDKRTGKWVDQNIMVPKRSAKESGPKLIIKNKKMKQQLEDEGFKLSSIQRSKSRGRMDYTIKKKPCPGSKVRSKGRGQGRGYGKGKGPIGRYKK